MQTQIASAAILPFRPRSKVSSPRVSARFSWRERAGIEEWAPQARLFGLTRLVVESEAEPGGFVLIYGEDKPWAAYGIGIEHGRFIAWRPATGVTFGEFDNLADAFAAVIANRTSGSMPVQL